MKNSGVGFKLIDDSIVIIRNKSVYKQVSAYERKGFIYAAAAGGFIKLRSDGATNHHSIVWEDMDGVYGHSLKKNTGDWLEVSDATK